MQSEKTKLGELATEKVGLLERLAEIAEQQKAVAAEIRAVEKAERETLKEVEELVAEGSAALAFEDIEAWAQTVYFSVAKTMLGNPHMYAARKRCDDAMFEKVAEFVQKNGYPQRYGSADYTVMDLDIHGEPHFVWTMGSPPSETVILNAKPDSMRPSE